MPVVGKEWSKSKWKFQLNVFAHSCGQVPGRACLEIDGAVDTVLEGDRS